MIKGESRWVMLKRIYLILGIILLGLLSVTSCALGEGTADSQQQYLDQVLKIYGEFLQGKIEAKGTAKIPVENFKVTQIFSEDENLSWFTVYDINGDHVPELHLKTMRSYYILRYAEGQLIVQYEGSGYDELRNDGSLLTTILGSAPTHINYVYKSFSEDWAATEIEFEQYDSNEDGLYDERDLYIYDGSVIGKEEYDALTENIVSEQQNLILWSNYWVFKSAFS